MWKLYFSHICCGLILVMYFAGCKGSKSNSASRTPFTKQCPSSDVDCYLEGLSFVDDGQEVKLTTISNDLITLGSSTNAPSITSGPQSLEFTSADPQEIEVGWEDPNGAQPAFCVQLCTGSGAKRKCTVTSRCTGSYHDGKTSGVLRTAVVFKAGPAGPEGTQESLGAVVTPLSMPGGADPIAFLAANGAQPLAGLNTVSVGEPAQVPIQVINQPSNTTTYTPIYPIPGTGGNTGGATPGTGGFGGISSSGGETCASFTSTCAACSIDSCVTSDANGNCLLQRYKTSDGGSYPCNACSDCNAAAQAVVNHCLSTCLGF